MERPIPGEGNPQTESDGADLMSAVLQSDRGIGTLRFSPDALGHALLLLIALGVAWFPVETRPFAAVAIAGVVLALSTWGWRRSSAATTHGLAGGLVVLAVLVCSAASGWDPARGEGEIGLVAAVLALAWLASRSRPPMDFPVLLAIGLSGLAVWGIWQAVVGLNALLPGIEALPDATRAYAEERVAGRRAYASLLLPSHLAVLLATALPLLVARVKTTPAGVVAAIGVGLTVIGLAATKSPVGIGLAILAVTAVVIGRNSQKVLMVALLLAVALVVVVAVRPDVVRLEPVALRADNWRTALWLSETSPCSGVGFSSFAQASQAVPFEVGNRPAHAHNIVMESLAELGPTGLVGCLVLGFWLLRLIRRLWPQDRAVAVALAVVPLHNLLDFSFFVSGVVVPWAVLLGWGVARSRESAAVSESIRGRISLVIVASVALAMTCLHATSVVVEQAAASQVVAVDRFDGALRSLRLAPWRVEPQFLLASASLESGDPSLHKRAWNELDRRRWWRPRSAALAQRRARVALARGDVSVAASELWIAVEEGFPTEERKEALQELLTALKSGTHGPPS